MHEPTSRLAPKRTAITEWGLWFCLLVGLSFVLRDLVGHWTTAPWSRYSISFLVLLFLAARADSPGPPRKRAGLLLLVVGLVGQTFALSFWIVALGRPFAALAVLGMLLYFGTMSLRAALLVLWVVPLPMMVIEAFGGEAAARGIYVAGAALLEPFGMAFEFGRRVVSSGANELPVAEHQGGLVLAAQMSGLAWYSALRRGLTWGWTARLIAGYALLALPIQFAAVVVTLALLSWGSPRWMIQFIDTATWLLPFLVVVQREAKRNPA
jgi:hypothetical protein